MTKKRKKSKSIKNRVSELSKGPPTESFFKKNIVTLLTIVIAVILGFPSYLWYKNYILKPNISLFLTGIDIPCIDDNQKWRRLLTMVQEMEATRKTIINSASKGNNVSTELHKWSTGYYKFCEETFLSTFKAIVVNDNPSPVSINSLSIMLTKPTVPLDQIYLNEYPFHPMDKVEAKSIAMYGIHGVDFPVFVNSGESLKLEGYFVFDPQKLSKNIDILEGGDIYLMGSYSSGKFLRSPPVYLRDIFINYPVTPYGIPRLIYRKLHATENINKPRVFHYKIKGKEYTMVVMPETQKGSWKFIKPPIGHFTMKPGISIQDLEVN